MLPRRIEIIALTALMVAVLALVIGLRLGPLASAAGPAGPDAPAANAAIPSTFNYQGTLRLADGSLANDAYTITIKLYDAAVGGNELHSETFTNVAVRDGLFKVVLGDSVAISPTVFADAPRFVGITVSPDPEMVPRQRLHPVPWAQQATTAVNAVTATTLIPNAVVPSFKMTGNSSLRIDGPPDAQVAPYLSLGAHGGFMIDSPGTSGGRFVVSENGRVGIGTAAPEGPLTVNGYALSIGPTAGYSFRNREGGSDWVWYSNNQVARLWNSNANADRIWIDTGGNLAASGNVTAIGKVIANRGFTGVCTYNATGIPIVVCNQDVAETFATTEQTEPGDLVVMLPQSATPPAVRRAGQAYESGLVGVVSTNPGLVFDQGHTYLAGENTNLITADKTVVAMIGRVPVKVSLENGPIAVGDPLTSSSVPGMAMKATRAGQILGYAMQASDEMVDGKLLAWLQVGYYLPSQLVTSLNDGSSTVQTVAALQSENAQLKTQLAALETRLSAVERQGQAASLPGGWLALVGLVLGAVVVGGWKRGR
ncbi:MAG: hypothetical protein KIT87_19305 [Anaerolineae bacterium]|nr:hypothetical protein [Anaerolineae bacterium]